MNIYILLMLVVVAYGKSIRFINCPNTKIAGVTSVVDVDPCPTEPCVLHKGNNTLIKIGFVPNGDTEKIDVYMKGKIGPIWVPFPLSPKSACDKALCQCPLHGEKLYTFSRLVPISKDYPTIEVKVSIELKRPDDEMDIACVEFPVQLK